MGFYGTSFTGQRGCTLLWPWWDGEFPVKYLIEDYLFNRGLPTAPDPGVLTPLKVLALLNMIRANPVTFENSFYCRAP